MATLEVFLMLRWVDGFIYQNMEYGKFMSDMYQGKYGNQASLLYTISRKCISEVIAFKSLRGCLRSFPTIPSFQNNPLSFP